MTKADSNSHRAGKKPFQAFLTPPETRLVDLAKETTNQTTQKGLLLYLVRECLGVPEPIEGLYAANLEASETTGETVSVDPSRLKPIWDEAKKAIIQGTGKDVTTNETPQWVAEEK